MHGHSWIFLVGPASVKQLEVHGPGVHARLELAAEERRVGVGREFCEEVPALKGGGRFAWTIRGPFDGPTSEPSDGPA